MNYTATSTDTPHIRALYRLREQLEPLRPRKPSYDEWTQTNSAPAWWLKETAQTRAARQAPIEAHVNDPLSQVTLYEFEGVQLPFLDVTAKTVSEAVFALTGVRSRALARTLDALLKGARDERFEDGMDSNLGVGLRVLLRDYSIDFARILDDRLKDPKISARILAEVLHTLGAIKDAAMRDWRLATLVRFLTSPSPIVRDAAAVGLAYLDDKRAIPHLREAIARETSETLQEDFRAIVAQLSA